MFSEESNACGHREARIVAARICDRVTGGARAQAMGERFRIVMTPSPNRAQVMVRESSCPLREWKGFSDEESPQCRAGRGPATSG